MTSSGSSPVIVLPLVTIIHGRRAGTQRPWLSVVVTLFTSFSFGWALYIVTLERQRRLAEGQAGEAVRYSPRAAGGATGPTG